MRERRRDILLAKLEKAAAPATGELPFNTFIFVLYLLVIFILYYRI
jgi:hypothetical protein